MFFLVARLQRAVTALHFLMVLHRVPARDRAIRHRCQDIRDLLWQIEMDATPPVKPKDYYDFSQAEKTGASE